jgi:hypothetical protein
VPRSTVYSSAFFRVFRQQRDGALCDERLGESWPSSNRVGARTQAALKLSASAESTAQELTHRPWKTRIIASDPSGDRILSLASKLGSGRRLPEMGPQSPPQQGSRKIGNQQ